MSTVFNLTYDANVSRLQSSHEEKRKVGRQSKVGDFSTTLSEVETKQGKSQDSNILGERGSNSLATPSLVNLSVPSTLDSASPIQSALEPAESLSVMSALTGAKEDRSCVSNLTGKLPSSSIQPLEISSKSLPPPPVIIDAHRIQEHAPEPPRIVSAKGIISENIIPKLSREDELLEIIETAGKFHGIEHELGVAIAKVESDLNPRAISRDGHYSKGMFQLLDTTAHGMRRHTGMTDAYDPFDPAQNSYLGLAYLSRLKELFSKDTVLSARTKTIAVKSPADLEKLSIAAYNAGEGNVARAQARARANGKDPTNYDSVKSFLPTSTREYVNKVLTLRNTLLADNSSPGDSKSRA